MRDTTAAADSLMRADDAWLREIALRDPDMIRDVATALIHSRTPKGPGCGAIECVNACEGCGDYKYCPHANGVPKGCVCEGLAGDGFRDCPVHGPGISPRPAAPGISTEIKPDE